MNAAATDPRERLGEFAHYLREHGFTLGYAEVDAMTRAAAALPPAQWARVEAAWRGIAAGNRAQWARYPELHRAWWFPERVRASTRSSGLQRKARSLPEAVQQLHDALGDAPPAAPRRGPGGPEAAGDGAPQADATPRVQGGASRVEALAERDFSDWMPGDIDRFEPAVEAFQRRLRAQLLRRWQPHAASGTIHLRRSLRAAQATGGELIALHHVRRRRRPPRVVVLVDVSRSMEVHAAFYLRLARAFVEVTGARAFVFHTRVAEVTPLMKRRSERVQEKINAVTFAFGGGTRIAHCLHDALHRHLGRALGGGDWFLVCSDGYDTDEPQALGEVLAQVKARGARIGWLHPTREAPASAAMQAAREHVARFLPAHDLASLGRLPDLLAAG